MRGVSNKEPPKEYLELKAERDKEIARLTREFEERDKQLLAKGVGKDTSPDVFNIPATPAPLRVRKQRKDRPISDRPLSEVPQIPKRSASRRSSKRSSLIPSSETYHTDLDAIEPLPMIDASRIEPEVEVEEKQAEVLSLLCRNSDRLPLVLQVLSFDILFRTNSLPFQTTRCCL